MLIIVSGLPGSGKTTIAKLLSKHYRAVHISSDVVRKQMFAKPSYTNEEKEKVYEEMAGLAEKELAEGKNVVADATFNTETRRKTMMAVAEKADVSVFVVFCTLPEEEIRKRIGNRKKGPSDADFEVYLKMKKEFEPITQKHLEISTWSKKEIMEKATKFIGE